MTYEADDELNNLIADAINLDHITISRGIEDRVAHPRQARITGYNPATPHLVKVLLLPEGDAPVGPPGTTNVFETGWIQYAPVAAGAGWGIYAPPTIGAQVSVIFQEHDNDNPIVIARHNDANNLPPSGPAYESGEIIAYNNFGVTIYMKSDGSMYSTAPGGAGFTFVGNGTLQGNWVCTGTMLVEQLLTAQEGISATGSAGITTAGNVIAGYGGSNIGLLGHQHSGVTAGGSDTGPPVAVVGSPMRIRAAAKFAARKRVRP